MTKIHRYEGSVWLHTVVLVGFPPAPDSLSSAHPTYMAKQNPIAAYPRCLLQPSSLVGNVIYNWELGAIQYD